MTAISNQTRALIDLSTKLNIPHVILQTIVVETCASIDTLLFNVIIVMTQEFNEMKLQALLQKVRTIQLLFDCLPANFEAAFPVSLEFIAQTMALWMGEVVVKSDRMRSVIEMCPRDLPLPWDRLDEIGKRVQRQDQLKLPRHVIAFRFSYEWLYTRNPTGRR
jgi:hypothetical protein